MDRGAGRRTGRGPLAFAVGCALALGACTVSERRGALLSTRRREERCSGPGLQGDLLPVSAARVRLQLSGHSRCSATTEQVFQVERWGHFSTPGALAVTTGFGVAGALAAMVAFGGGRPPPARPTPEGGTRVAAEAMGWIGFGVGAVLGAIVAGVSRWPLAAGREQEVRPTAAAAQRWTPRGPLQLPPERQPRPLFDGGAEVSEEELAALDLTGATAEGLPVSWSPAALERLAALAACQRALARRDPTAALDCRVLDDALRCGEGGFALAEPVKAARR